ncbi:hypothetical protein BE20_19110 [Sorangium cellulosum]|uniref:Uncharacterized protein n=1 Tax=Sorangium cellulosum TaxID=56 RepID=A0A150SL28_SORCE|nr:hypothetical protein BE20_19110 [Sorangium cellulosum]KYF93172.1 hypothetical protein BE18_05915 [Sorangium cellulosum]
MTVQDPNNFPPSDATVREASSPESDDPLGLVSDWDALNPPQPAPSQPGPDTSPVEPQRFPRLFQVAQDLLHQERRYLHVGLVISGLDPRVRAGVDLASQALQQAEDRLVAICISAGLLEMIADTAPDLEDFPTAEVAVAAFHRGFAIALRRGFAAISG